MKPPFKIVKKNDHNAVYASGFHDQARAEQWIERYDPARWSDKTVMAEDLEIIEDRPRGRK